MHTSQKALRDCNLCIPLMYESSLTSMEPCSSVPIPKYNDFLTDLEYIRWDCFSILENPWASHHFSTQFQRRTRPPQSVLGSLLIRFMEETRVDFKKSFKRFYRYYRVVVRCHKFALQNAGPYVPKPRMRSSLVYVNGSVYLYGGSNNRDWSDGLFPLGTNSNSIGKEISQVFVGDGYNPKTVCLCGIVSQMTCVVL